MHGTCDCAVCRHSETCNCNGCLSVNKSCGGLPKNHDEDFCSVTTLPNCMLCAMYDEIKDLKKLLVLKDDIIKVTTENLADCEDYTAEWKCDPDERKTVDFSTHSAAVNNVINNTNLKVAKIEAETEAKIKEIKRKSEEEMKKFKN